MGLTEPLELRDSKASQDRQEPQEALVSPDFRDQRVSLDQQDR